MRRFALLLAIVLLGAGCAAPPIADLPTEPPVAAPVAEMPETQDPATNVPAVNVNRATPPAPTPAPTPAPFYISYTSAQYQKALADKRPIVLYFWASWCPICRADEPIVKRRVESSALPIAGFRVDFDTQSDLKAQFRIPYQHTTVVLDVNGRESVRFTGPVDDVTFATALKKATGN